MLITANFIVSVGRESVNEDVQIEVPDDFFEWPRDMQDSYIEGDFNSWLGSNCDSGFDIKRP